MFLRALAITLGMLLAALPAHAQITTQGDAGFIQVPPVSPEQQQVIDNPEPKKQLEIRAGESRMFPSPSEVKPKAAAKAADKKDGTADDKAADTKEDGAPVEGLEVCDVVAQVIARDFRVIIAMPHSSNVDIQTLARGPYDVAIKSIVPYSNVYTAMGCDGKKLQNRIADTLRKAVAESKGKKR